MRKTFLALAILPCFALAATRDDLDSSVGKATDEVSTTAVAANDLAADQAKVIAKLRATNAIDGPMMVGGIVTAAPGATVVWPMTFIASSSEVSGLQTDITFPAGITVGSVQLGAAALAANKQIATNVINGATRILLFGINQTILGDGNLLNVTLTLPSTMRPGVYSITMGNIVTTNPSGKQTLLSVTSGTIEVQ